MRNNKDCSRFFKGSEQIILSNDEDGEQIQIADVKKEFQKVRKKNSKKNFNKDVSLKTIDKNLEFSKTKKRTDDETVWD